MNTAFVKIWGEIVGAVAWDEKTGLASFEYDSKFKTRYLCRVQSKSLFAYSTTCQLHGRRFC